MSIAGAFPLDISDDAAMLAGSPPTSYGLWNSMYERFARCDDLGVWDRLFEQVADDPDMQSVMIDATVVRAHACAAGAPQKTAARRRRDSGVRPVGSARRFMCWSMPSATL